LRRPGQMQVIRFYDSQDHKTARRLGRPAARRGAGQFEDALWRRAWSLPTVAPMLDVNALKPQDLQGLSEGAMGGAASSMLAQIAAPQAKQLSAKVGTSLCSIAGSSSRTP
jgi:hypothetical protein